LVRVGYDQNGVATLSFSGTVGQFADDEVPYHVFGNYPGTTSGGYLLTTNGFTKALSSGSVAAGSKLDNREVTISCTEIDTSYYKGPSVNGTSRHAHQRNLDGSIQTDSVAAYDLEWYGGLPFYGGDHFTANPVNFSSPSYAWAISQTDGSGRSYSFPAGNKQTIPVMLDLGPHIDGFPKHSTINVNVTDGLDGAQGANTYDVTWHLPYERQQLIFEEWTKHELGTRCTDVEPDRPATMAPEPAKDYKYAPLIDGVALLVPEGAAVKGVLELVAKLAEMSEFKFSFSGEAASAPGGVFNNDTINYGDAVKEQDTFIYVGDEKNYPINLGPAASNYWECKMTVKLMEHDHNRRWYADGYTNHGFDGNSTHVIGSSIIDSVFSERFFHRFREHNGTPADDNTVGDSGPG
jgi:hypothetical protein